MGAFSVLSCFVGPCIGFWSSLIVSELLLLARQDRFFGSAVSLSREPLNVALG
jgi:hypothetical protein